MSRGGEAKAALKVTSHLVKFIGKNGVMEDAAGSDEDDEGDGNPEIDFYSTDEIPF